MSVTFNPVDVHVGNRIRLRRNILGLSQQELALSLGITFQQVQKYERGANRISASRLYHISKVLSVEIPFFFDDFTGDLGEEGIALSSIGEETPRPYSADPMQSDETLRLIRVYYKLDADTREGLVQFLEKAAAPTKRARTAGTVEEDILENIA